MGGRSILDTRGRVPTTTAKVLCNKLTYAIVRSFKEPPPEGWVHSRWHWYRSPFSLRRQILWSRPLGAWFYVEDEDSIENMLHLQDYEPVSWVAPERGGIFLDVGAHIGWYTIRAARAVGQSGRVIALEPAASNRNQLERNLELNKMANYTIVPLAAWSKAGPVRWSPSHVSVWNKVDESGGTEKLEAVALDDLVSKLSLPQVDWIKMDIEGAETEALRGAATILRKFHPVLFIEVHECMAELRGLLPQFGYAIERAEFDQPPERHGWILARAL
jgi:FkbM family methyltransferase